MRLIYDREVKKATKEPRSITTIDVASRMVAAVTDTYEPIRMEIATEKEVTARAITPQDSARSVCVCGGLVLFVCMMLSILSLRGGTNDF